MVVYVATLILLLINMLFDKAFKEQFADIRCFDDTEVKKILQDLKDSTRLEFVFSQLFPKETIDTKELYSCTTVDSIQRWLIHSLIPKISYTYTDIHVRGIEALDRESRYVFISNHRDIAMDPILINLALNQSGHETAHNAIGDNLLLSMTGTRMALLNKCFRVARSVKSPKAMLIALKKQANYIRQLRLEHHKNIWIAQREGRALDGVDQTNPALIKMLSLGVERTEHLSTLKQLKIVPVTLSYEWDPCDQNKARRVLDEEPLSADDKLTRDKFDVLTGLIGFKGNITATFGSPLDLSELENVEARHLSDAVSEQLDTAILSGYAVYPINTLAQKLCGKDFNKVTDLSQQESKALDSLCQRLNVAPDLSNLSNTHKQVIRAYAQQKTHE